MHSCRGKRLSQLLLQFTPDLPAFQLSAEKSELGFQAGIQGTLNLSVGGQSGFMRRDSGCMNFLGCGMRNLGMDNLRRTKTQLFPQARAGLTQLRFGFG